LLKFLLLNTSKTFETVYVTTDKHCDVLNVV